MHSKNFNEYRRARFETGGNPNENVTSKNEHKEDQITEKEYYTKGDWYKHHAAEWKGAFPRMFYSDQERNPNLNLSKAGFLALAMSKHMGYGDQPIHLTSGERLGYDQWRVMKKYQYPQDMNLYDKEFRSHVKDSVRIMGLQNAGPAIVDWIEQQYQDFEQGLISEEELKKKVSSHIVGDAGDFVGPFRTWLRGSGSKDFRTAFNVNPLDEGDHYHVPFDDIDPSTLSTELQAHYYHFEDMFNRLAKENDRGELRIDMNPSSYSLSELSGLANLQLESIPITEIPTINKEPELIKAKPIDLSTMPKSKGPSIWDRLGFENGGNPEWRKRARAEYGLNNQPQSPVHEKELRANVGLIQPQKPITQGHPLWVGPTIPSFMLEGLTESKEEETPTFSVNKYGWADIDHYRSKKDDLAYITEQQNLALTEGRDIKVDGAWGNQTYNAINQTLVNQQLDAYTNPYFTDAEFQAQIWKESGGKNSTVSGAGARGISQFMPKTFKWAKEKGWIPETAKITDPAAQALAQRRYMDYLYEDRTNIKSAKTTEERKARTFAAYNMGPAAFDEFWGELSDADKKAGWKTWYKKANNESKMYVLWNMDRATYKKDYSTPYKHKRGYMTSKWNDVNYGFDAFVKKNEIYRYK